VEGCLNLGEKASKSEISNICIVLTDFVEDPIHLYCLNMDLCVTPRCKFSPSHIFYHGFFVARGLGEGCCTAMLFLFDPKLMPIRNNDEL